MANESSPCIANKVPSLADLERRFAFIDDETLRQNIVLAFQYVTFLIAVIDSEQAEGTSIGSSINKNLILYTATIIEGCLHYCLKKYMDKGVVVEQDVMKTVTQYKDSIVLYCISDTETLCCVTKIEAHEPFAPDLQFQPPIRACKRANILTDTLYDMADDVRQKRNKVHLAGLGSVDDSYSKSDVQTVFSAATTIIQRVESLVTKM